MGDLQTVPAVAANGTSASITLANITSGTTYDDPIAFSPAGLGLNSGNYYLVNAATGAAVPQTQQSNGLICATANISAATLAQWNVVAGTPPSGTASSSCPVTETGATSVTATAGQTSAGLQFLGVGQTNAGSDGNLTQITQGGETAEETWTSSQSGAGDANVYLQLNPMSAVEAASNVTVQVTYWATAGQGFTVQYDTPSNAYQNGPTVTSPGTGTWATATVQLTGAQFNEAQNGGADLRLNVTNASAPLIVQSITMSTTNPSGPVLTASPTSLSFGNEAVGSATAAQTVTVSNTGTASATLSSVSAAAPFAETNTCGTSLAAGASCTASVTFKPTAGGAASGDLSVASNAPGSPLNVGLSGTGTSTAEGPYGGTPAAVPGTVQAANYDTGGQGVAYNVTSVNGTGNATALTASTWRPPPTPRTPPAAAPTTWAGPRPGSGSNTPSTWPRPGTYTVSYRLASPSGVTDALHIDNSAGTNLSGSINAPDTGGWQTWATVTSTVTLPAGVQTLTIDQDNAGWNIHYLSLAAASGSGSPLSASPSSESFGNENVGSTSSAQPVTVTNPGTTAVSMSSIGVTGPFGESNNCGTSLAAGASCTVSVTFAPTAAGAATGTLSVNSSAPGSPLTVALSGTGASANTDLALNMPVTASSYTQVYTPVQRRRRQHQHLLGSQQRRLAQHHHRQPAVGPDPRLHHRRPPAVLGLVDQNPDPLGPGIHQRHQLQHPGRLRHLHLEPVHRQHRHHPAPVRHQGPVRGAQLHRQQRPERRPGLRDPDLRLTA